MYKLAAVSIIIFLKNLLFKARELSMPASRKPLIRSTLSKTQYKG